MTTTRSSQILVRSRIAFALIGLIALMAMGCGAGADPSPATPDPSPPAEPGQVIVLGDIDSSEPIKKIKRFGPLADYLAAHLKEFGIDQGNVVIARDIREMGRFLSDGTVDIYFDSPFPTLAVQELSGSRIVARRWKGGDANYWSIYITLRDKGMSGIEDFVGKVLAFESPESTSGFVLPAGTLLEQGFALKELERPDTRVAPGEIGYYFSDDEENTVALFLGGMVAGGGFSNQDYQGLPEELMNQITQVGRTIAVPRQLVSVRPGLDPRLASRVIELLIGLDQTEGGRLILGNLKKTKKFDVLPADSSASLEDLRGLMRLVFP